MAETRFELFEGFGVTDGTDVESFDEQWLKRVAHVDMALEEDHLCMIQLLYEDITMVGGVYGNDTISPTDSDRSKQAGRLLSQTCVLLRDLVVIESVCNERHEHLS